jgi:hypothetical protein
MTREYTPPALSIFHKITPTIFAKIFPKKTPARNDGGFI